MNHWTEKSFHTWKFIGRVFHAFCKYKYKILVWSKIVIILYYSFFLTYTIMYWLRLHVHQFTPVLFSGNGGIREPNMYPISALTGLYSTWARLPHTATANKSYLFTAYQNVYLLASFAESTFLCGNSYSTNMLCFLFWRSFPPTVEDWVVVSIDSYCLIRRIVSVPFKGKQ